VWDATVAGRRLTFHLAGINNQNFLMQDDETGSWWQQASGEAILGPLAGHRLQLVPYDEVSFALWRREHPGGRVLRPAAGTAWRAFSADWEAQTARLPVPRRPEAPEASKAPQASKAPENGSAAARARGAAGLPPRTLVLGVEVRGEAKAYPVALLARQSPLLDTVGGVPLAILVGDDGRSLRVFEARLAGRPVTLYQRPGPAAAPSAASVPPPPAAPSAPSDPSDPSERRWVDAETGSEWDFTGRALSGPAAGRRLERLPALADYWFDWQTYHPRTTLYRSPGVGLEPR
jgi:hypothetical protein